MSGDERLGERVLESLIAAWRAIIVGEGKSWVLFEHGTGVILPEPEGDLAAQAVALMREFGPVRVATPSADFSVVVLADHPGYVVTCHHPDILTYVGPDEVDAEPEEVAVGLLGRSKRNWDAEELRVVHVEDRRR